jgi:hypothetical protein
VFSASECTSPPTICVTSPRPASDRGFYRGYFGDLEIVDATGP